MTKSLLLNGYPCKKILDEIAARILADGKDGASGDGIPSLGQKHPTLLYSANETARSQNSAGSCNR